MGPACKLSQKTPACQKNFKPSRLKKKIFFHLPKLCFACVETEIYRTRYLVSIKKTSSGKEIASNFQKTTYHQKNNLKLSTSKNACYEIKTKIEWCLIVFVPL